MDFTIKFTPNALEHLHGFKKFEQKVIGEAIKSQLANEPLTETRNRKLLRPNPLSRWELRVGEFRIFYDVVEEGQIVQIKAIGYKERNKLFIYGREFEL
jgi:mRNA-degrading endonuclease RelE of RelBE toxin-antitoxin system